MSTVLRSFSDNPIEQTNIVPSSSNQTTVGETQTVNGGAVAAAAPPPFSPALDVLALNPANLEVCISPLNEEDNTADAFVPMFRGSANYIANHRNTLAVYHIPGSLLDMEDTFRDVMNDISLTWLLGMKIVLVVGCRHQIDKRLPHRKIVKGVVITDEEALRVVKEEAGYVRFEVERQLARSLRMHGTTEGNVVSGNFYSAQPFGVLDGVDYKFSGFVRRVEVDKIRQVHASRDICLLTTLGVSPSGEVFNCNSHSLAATVAGSMSASKIIFFTDVKVELRNKAFDSVVQNLRLSDAKNMLEYRGTQIHKKGFVTLAPGNLEESVETNTVVQIGWATIALEQGVKRAHIIAPTHGALLQELYTRDGSGTMISGDLYDGVRRANVIDVGGIYDLISPLIKLGTLIDRPKAVLEKDIEDYFVYTRDNLIVACAQLKKFEDGFAEIGCLVVRAEYRAQGRGDAMLGYLERLCLSTGRAKVFVLSTQTMEWFIERGFEEVGVDKLPPSRQATYNYDRGSKIYMKKIDSERDLDASELWWNR
jgi:amino-acid N-acetyltransferase